MVYLHEAPYSDGLVRHWANESESASDTDATYMIRQIETNILYSEAVDVVPCQYTYEVTDEPIPTRQTDELNDAIRALNMLGVK